jgi:hypothetical protein
VPYAARVVGEEIKKLNTEKQGNESETPPPTPPRIQGGERDKESWADRLHFGGNNRPLIMSRRLAVIAVILLVVVGPLATTLALTVRNVENGFPTAIDPFLVNPDDARKVADYVNSHSQPDNVIVASPVVGWQFHANTADFQMSIAATGVDTPHLPGDIPPNRWAFDPSYQKARYVVVDNLWTNWGAPDVPGVRAMLEVVEKWPVVFSSGAIQVYQNPGST